MLYELILINEIEQRAKIIFLSVLHFINIFTHAFFCTQHKLDVVRMW